MIFDIKGLIREAIEDRKLRRRAMYDYMPEAVKRLADDDWDESVLHISDLGSCSLAVAARVAGMQRPADWQTQLGKYDDGAISGAYLASLARAALEKHHPDFKIRAIVEMECSYRGLTGHADLAIVRELDNGDYRELDLLHVTEFKKSFFNAPIERPEVPRKNGDSNVHFVLQCAGYALSDNGDPDTPPAPDMSIVIYDPAIAAWSQKTKQYFEPTYVEQYDYTPLDWKEDVDRNVERLNAAVKDMDGALRCDAKDSWRPRLCRFDACPKKKAVAHA